MIHWTWLYIFYTSIYILLCTVVYTKLCIQYFMENLRVVQR